MNTTTIHTLDSGEWIPTDAATFARELCEVDDAKWTILNLYTGCWEPVDTATAASVFTHGITVRLMDLAEVEVR